MLKKRGTIVVMGSGELTATMVEVHKSLLRSLGKSALAVFVDTPAGFQLNVDHIYQKAADYFSRRVEHPLGLASFKTAQIQDQATPEQTYATLRRADYMLIGPGSPTYALQQWQQSPIPGLMIDLIERGGCLVAASAAALTVGRASVPVYEIYKVGQPTHWVDGLDLLGHFGFNMVVVPHWNNAEGGNHDTRYCFMGVSRLEQLERMLPGDSTILGLDEHTALIIDLAQSAAVIRGMGRVTLRRNGREQIFHKGDTLPLALLRGEDDLGQPGPTRSQKEHHVMDHKEDDVWPAIHALADSTRQALENGRDEKVAGHLLELEGTIWRSQKELEMVNEMGAARELMRELITLLAAEMASRPASAHACMAPLAKAMIELREYFRAQKEWEAADSVRESLLKANINVSDTPGGSEWSLIEP